MATVPALNTPPLNTLATGPTLSTPSAVAGQTAAGGAYPVLVPTAPVGSGVGRVAGVLPPLMWYQPSDKTIAGAIKIDPSTAHAFIFGRKGTVALNAIPGGQEPLEVKNKAATQTLASYNSPNYWKSRAAPKMSQQMLFGNQKPQKPFIHPWVKKFISPLALFNDASQWVNVLTLVHPLTRWGFASSIFPLRPAGLGAIIPPINTQNLAAGTLNLQLQLGTIKIQGAQLTTLASTYYGGS